MKHNADYYAVRLMIWFLRLSLIFLSYGLIYYSHISDNLFHFRSIYTFIEAAFYLPAIGISGAMLFKWYAKRNNSF